MAVNQRKVAPLPLLCQLRNETQSNVVRRQNASEMEGLQGMVFKTAMNWVDTLHIVRA